MATEPKGEGRDMTDPEDLYGQLAREGRTPKSRGRRAAEAWHEKAEELQTALSTLRREKEEAEREVERLRAGAKACENSVVELLTCVENKCDTSCDAVKRAKALRAARRKG